MTATRVQTAAAADNYHDNDAVEAHIARVMRLQPGTVHQLMHGRESAFVRAAAMTRELVVLGRAAKARDLCRGIVAALAGIQAPALTDLLLVREARAAADVEVARALYQASHCDADLAHLERAIRIHARIEHDVEAAIGARNA